MLGQEQQPQGVGGSHQGEGDGPEAGDSGGRLSAQLLGRLPALPLAGLVLQNVAQIEKQGLLIRGIHFSHENCLHGVLPRLLGRV